MTPSEFATFASPVAVVAGMIFNAYWFSRKRTEEVATANAHRDAADETIAAKLEATTKAATKADEHLAESIEALAKRFDETIREFQVSNERSAKHELDCAEFRGATVKALEQLAKAAELSTSVRERLAVFEERLNQHDDSIEWGTRRFEELFRGQAALARGTSPPTISMEEPLPRPPARRTPRGRT